MEDKFVDKEVTVYVVLAPVYMGMTGRICVKGIMLKLLPVITVRNDLFLEMFSYT